MLTERRKSVMDTAVQLSPGAQDRLAEEIEAALDNAIWDAQLADPRSDDVLAALVANAKQQSALPLPTPRDMGDEEDAGNELARSVGLDSTVRHLVRHQ
jgi:hypothetical protein